jgi:hypothetical protein
MVLPIETPDGGLHHMTNLKNLLLAFFVLTSSFSLILLLQLWNAINPD